MKSTQTKNNTSSDPHNHSFFQKESSNNFFAKKDKPFFNASTIQTKLTVNQPNDKYEQEADDMADKVVQRLSAPEIMGVKETSKPSAQGVVPLVQTKGAACDQEEKLQKKEEGEEKDLLKGELQKKPIFESNSEQPGYKKDIQRKCAECEKEKLQKKEEDESEESTELIQSKPIFESNSEQRGDEKNIQRKCAECEKEKLQKKEEDESEESTELIQSKPIFESNSEQPDDDEGIQRKAGETLQKASTNIESGLSASRTSGSPLPQNTREQMESSFGADFSGVRIHNDSTSVQMSKDLNAQAFTHGSDIFFNSGKFDTNSSKGKHLLAHELTHVIQQNSHGFVQRQVADKIPETRNQFYAHGAFMGAAPQLMADKKWNRILQVLMPDVHAAATKTLKKGPQSDELILMFENNPVMAAYGMYRTKQMDIKREQGRSDRISKMEAIEWDVFLPTKIVEDYNKTKDDAEKARLAQAMVSEMIIAHGTPFQTFMENVWGKRQYEEVKKTPKTQQGGVRPGAWMDMFGKALQLATDNDWERKAKEYEDPKLHPRVDSPNDQAAHQTFKNQLSFREVIRLYKQIFGKETFSVLLDIKSRDASPTILRALVGELNLRGVLVYGVGSFNHNELEGLSNMKQTVDGKTYFGPREVKFFHFAGDLQNACLNNKIVKGDTVMFNAGSLISYKSLAGGKATKASYKIKTEVVDQLRIYKQHYGFQLGVYVQENDIDDRAATLITELTNKDTDIFDLGFAWGGLSGQAASDIEPSLTHATVGTYNQSKIGTHWDTGKTGPSLLSVPSKDVPLISQITYQEAQSLIHEKNFAMALSAVMTDLVETKKVNPKLYTLKFEDSRAHGEGKTEYPHYTWDPNSKRYLPDGPSAVTIFSPAFSSVQWLVSSIMHEYQHVLQQQRPLTKEEWENEDQGGKFEEYRQASEVEAYLWELENLKNTGVVNQPGSIRELLERLKDHYNQLKGFDPAHAAKYKERYDAAQKLAAPQTNEEKELEKCDKGERPKNYCAKLYKRVRDRYGNKERNIGFDPDKDVNKKRVRRDDPPIADSFRLIYNRLDSWDIYIKRAYEGWYEEFDKLFRLNEKRNKWLTELKEKTAGYKSEFRDVSNFDVENTKKEYEKSTLKKIETEINGLNHEIASWYKTKSSDPDDLNTIIEKVHKKGTELWRKQWESIIIQVNRILSSLWPPARSRIINWVREQRKLHPRTDLRGEVGNIDYVGSLATGYKGAPKQFSRFNVNKFDVDANIEAPPLAKYAMTIDKVKPDRKRIFAIKHETTITPLLNFCFDVHRALSDVNGYDASEQFDMVIYAPELPEQKRGREGTERIYNLREKLKEDRYQEMIGEIKAAGYLEEAEVGWRLKEELSKEDANKLNKILKKYDR
jgi:Domain of unknown function (DUF4157)